MSFLTGIALTLSVLAAPAAAASAQPADEAAGRVLSGRTVTTRALSRPYASARSEQPLARMTALGAAQTSDIQVTYTGFSANAQIAFEAAVRVWEHILVSTQVIHVDANWTSLPSGVLGSAGPTRIRLANDGYWYPMALAEAMCNCERRDGFEIGANFNSSFGSWYLGTDGNVPANKWDFFSVVLHELGHGLGFSSSFEVSGGLGFWGYSYQGSLYPFRFDSYERTAATGGNSLLNDYANFSAALKTQLTDGSVYFAGPNAVAAAGGRVKLYAPSPWQSGSSNSHVDQARYEGTAESLMTPVLVNGQADGAPGPITIAMMKDIGWTINTSSGGGGAPANDNFADAAGANLKSSKTATTTAATLESGEPQPGCATATDKTVWYSYTPGVNRTVIAMTTGSTFDTVLAIYTGSELASLTPVACSDNRAVDDLSRVKLTLTGGTTYWFQVGGANGDSGALTFRLKRP